MTKALPPLACVALVLSACQSFDRAEFARLSGRGDAMVDGRTPDVRGTDAAIDARPADGGPVQCAERMRDVGGGCSLAVIPTAPMGLQNTVDRARPVRVFAARQIAFGAGGLWQSIGFDRDGMCTTLANPTAVACRSSLPQADGMNGRDNTFGSVIASISALGSSFDETRLNRAVMRGNATLGLRLRDFGGRDDGSIIADLVPLVDGHPPGRPSDPPAWDGRDEWSIDRSLAYGADGTTARITTNEGFSSCGVVVAPFPNTAPLYFKGDVTRSQLTLTDTRIVGVLDASGNLPSIEFTSLWVRSNIFEDLRTFGACAELLPPADWLLINMGIDAALDLPASGTINPATPCSAMSVGFRVDLAPVTVTGDVNAPPPIVRDPCAAAADAGTRG